MQRRANSIGSNRAPVYLVGLATLWIGLLATFGQTRTLDCTRDRLPPDEKPRFFPVSTFGVGTGGTNEAGLLACHLRAMGELPLTDYLKEDAPQAYRLMVSPALRLPLIVRFVVRADGTGELSAKAQKGWKYPGVLAVDRVEKVSKPEVDKFMQLLEQASFWSLHTDQFYAENQRAVASANPRGRKIGGGIGGVEWNLEGAQGSNYHVVSRKLLAGDIPPDLAAYFDLTRYLFRDLAKLEVPPIEATPSKR